MRVTREEAIKKLEHYRYCLKFQYGWYGKDDDETLDMAIKALEQEPCEDCISRQAVLDINEHHHGQMPNHVNHEIWKEIKALPPVTPQQNMGYISIDDAMSAFDDFMCNDIEPEGQEVFLELLKDRAERSKK